MAASRSHRLCLTWGDWILVVVLVLISLASFVLVGQLVNRGTMGVVEVDGQEIMRLDLSIDVRRVVHGPLGDTTIQVKDGRIRVISSACPHKTCVRLGWVSGAGQMIACLPNRVVIRVEGAGKQDGKVDATTW